MIKVFIILASMSVPLAAILGHYAVKLRAIERARQLDPGVERLIRSLAAQNAELQGRVEVLETIATAPAPAHSPSPSSSSVPSQSPQSPLSPPSQSPSAPRPSETAAPSTSRSAPTPVPPYKPAVAHVSLTTTRPAATTLARR